LTSEVAPYGTVHRFNSDAPVLQFRLGQHTWNTRNRTGVELERLSIQWEDNFRPSSKEGAPVQVHY
jgi:hypothetical protein